MAGRFIWVEERLGSIPNSPIYYKSSSRPTLGGREESGGFGSRNNLKLLLYILPKS